MLNETQKNILNSIMQMDILEDLQSLDTANDALIVLNAMTDDNIYQESKEKLKLLNMIDVVDNIRKIFAHPNPQNRTSTGIFHPSLDPDRAYYYDDNGIVCSEPLGLLGLAASNDATAQHVTKEDVHRFINSILEKEKSIYIEKLALELQIESLKREHLQCFERLEKLQAAISDLENTNDKLTYVNKRNRKYAIEDLFNVDKKNLINGTKLSLPFRKTINRLSIEFDTKYIEDKKSNKDEKYKGWLGLIITSREPVMKNFRLEIEDILKFANRDFSGYNYYKKYNLLKEIKKQLDLHPDLFTKITVHDREYSYELPCKDLTKFNIQLNPIDFQDEVVSYLYSWVMHAFGQTEQPQPFVSKYRNITKEMFKANDETKFLSLAHDKIYFEFNTKEKWEAHNYEISEYGLDIEVWDLQDLYNNQPFISSYSGKNIFHNLTEFLEKFPNAIKNARFLRNNKLDVMVSISYSNNPIVRYLNKWIQFACDNKNRPGPYNDLMAENSTISKQKNNVFNSRKLNTDIIDEKPEVKQVSI